MHSGRSGVRYGPLILELQMCFSYVLLATFARHSMYASISYFHIAFLSGIIVVAAVIAVYCCLSHLLCSESVCRCSAEKGDIHFSLATLVVETKSRSRRCKFR